MLEAHPGDQSSTKGEVEEPFVRNGEDNKHRRESKEDYHQPVEVMVVRSKTVQERDGQRRH